MKTPKGTELKLINLQGKDYLPVNQRLIWFREERPEWEIHTDVIERTEKHSLVRAMIRTETGRIMAMAHKSDDHDDHTERAETGAIGRALALCGFGTQFTSNDFEEGDRIADAPIARGPSDRVEVTYDSQPANQKDKTFNNALERVQAARGGDPTKPLNPVSITFGKNKGRFIHELNDKQLDWYLENERKKEGGKFKPNQELIEAIEYEIHVRQHPDGANPVVTDDDVLKFDETESIPF